MKDTPAPIPVTVIGGYLGAGKTTLVNNLLRQADGLRLAVLVNEFGELPIDADLIESRDENVINIAGGCICCSYGSDLIEALRTLEKLDPAPNHLLIEASGVALPDVIAQSTTLITRYTVDGIVVLADADLVRRHGTDKYLAGTIIHQLGAADIVLLNKVDLSCPGTIQEIRHWLGDVCKDTHIVETVKSKISLPALLGTRVEPLLLNSDHNLPHADHHSVVLGIDRPIDPHILAERLSDTTFGLVRTKGFVTGLDSRTYMVQTVGQRCAAAAMSQPVEAIGYIVCIRCGDVIDRDALLAMVGEVQAAVD